MGKDISFRYARKNKRFIVTFNQQQNVETSCLEAVDKNNINNILFPKKVSKNKGSLNFVFNKAKLINIREYIEKEKCVLKDVIELLIKINYIIIVNKKYLEIEKFVRLNSNCVFIAPEQMDVYVICVPIENYDFWEEYFDFVVNDLLILPEKNNSTENIIKYISNYLKSDGFTIDKLNEILIDILKNAFGRSVAADSLYTNAVDDEKEEEFSIEQQKNRGTLKEKESYAPVILLGVFLQSIIIASGVFLYLDFFEFEYLSYSNNSMLFSVFFSIIVWFFIVRKLISISRNYNPIILTKVEIINIPELTNFNKIIHEEKYNKRFLETILPDFNYSTCAFLEMSVDGTYKRIFITKPAFTLGTNGEISDYIIESSNNIRDEGHVEILNRNGIYILVDCGFGYTIWLNSTKVENNSEVEIKHEDILDIADRKYVFKV